MVHSSAGENGAARFKAEKDTSCLSFIGERSFRECFNAVSDFRSNLCHLFHSRSPIPVPPARLLHYSTNNEKNDKLEL